MNLFCCRCNKKVFLQRDPNTYSCIKEVQTFKIKRNKNWKFKTVSHLKSINNRGSKKLNLGRKLLQEYIHETTEEATFPPKQDDKTSLSEWKFIAKNMLLNVLILILIVFTFFAIFISFVWLLTMYALKRLKIRNELPSGSFSFVTEL